MDISIHQVQVQAALLSLDLAFQNERQRAEFEAMLL